MKYCVKVLEGKAGRTSCPPDTTFSQAKGQTVKERIKICGLSGSSTTEKEDGKDRVCPSGGAR